MKIFIYKQMYKNYRSDLIEDLYGLSQEDQLLQCKI